MFGPLQQLIMFALTAGCFAVEVFALVDCLRRPARAFTSEGKKTKQFWSLLLGGTALVGFLGLQPPLGWGFLGLSALLVAIPSFIYLTDVRPAVTPYGYGNGNSGSGNNKRGGW
ncbi:DUF2516 family protein [Timonella senegalensis]|uniref:DUF2516 family protein n=1 Tax=Timonella senegalensis TaxID=1465825 RepID=UPI0028AB2285|nr:DUF2516 family protein [Timonella senegalensis]